MGLLDAHRRKAAEKAARKLAEQQAAREKAEAAAYEAGMARWHAERDELDQFFHEAQHWDGIDADTPLVLHKDEKPLLVLQGAGLIEPRRGPGHYQGGYSGFSFRVAKGVSYRIGGSRGTFVQGEEKPTLIDSGTVTITDHRIVFEGSKQTREWAFTKLLGYEHDEHQPSTLIHVSNRQKTSGILYDDAHTALVRFRIGLGVAMFTGKAADFAADIEQQVAELDKAQPVAPSWHPSAPPSAAPPPSV